MKREDLEQYRDLQRSIAYERQRLAKERQRKNVEVDTVTGSNPHFPYEKRVIPVYGEVTSSRQQRLERSLDRMLAREEEMMERILSWIEKIPSCRARRVFYWHYIEGVTLEEIGRRLHYSPSMVRKIRDQYVR